MTKWRILVKQTLTVYRDVLELAQESQVKTGEPAAKKIKTDDHE